MTDYLGALTLRLAEGLSRLPAEFRARHAGYLARTQNADGGFSGRESGSDLYYTGFALRGLAVLDALTLSICEKSAEFLKLRLTGDASVVDFYSLLYSCLLIQLGGGPDVLAGSPEDWPNRVAQTLETFRTMDGGYGKVTGAASGSTYHTFLVCLCYELLGRTVPRSDEVVGFIHARRRDDGGYVEIAPMRKSGTNPTAAAVGTLQIVRGTQFAAGDVAGVADFLADMPSFEGGMRANGRAPLADLLSTFTGVWTLSQLNALERVDTNALRSFAASLELPDGGFHGGLWDEHSDVEYTFYGLGTLALLTP